MKGSDNMKKLVKTVSAAAVAITTLFVVLEILNQKSEYEGDYDID